MTRPYTISVTWYSKATEKLVGEVPLLLPEPRLREIFGLPPDQMLGDGYAITEHERAAIEEATGLKMDMNTHLYFMELTAA